jgi:thiol-disulfide isomerase/thioredoxin
MKKEIIPIVIPVILLVSILSGCLQSSNSNEDEGEDFTFTTLDGSKKHLSDYRGKVVILDLWATWCGPCISLMFELKQVYDSYSREDVVIISVNIDMREDFQDIQDFKQSLQKNYGLESDWIFGKDDGSIAERFLKEGKIPTVCIFDRKGKLHLREAKVFTSSELATILDELI